MPLMTTRSQGPSARAWSLNDVRDPELGHIRARPSFLRTLDRRWRDVEGHHPVRHPGEATGEDARRAADLKRFGIATRGEKNLQQTSTPALLEIRCFDVPRVASLPQLFKESLRFLVRQFPLAYGRALRF